MESRPSTPANSQGGILHTYGFEDPFGPDQVYPTDAEEEEEEAHPEAAARSAVEQSGRPDEAAVTANNNNNNIIHLNVPLPSRFEEVEDEDQPPTSDDDQEQHQADQPMQDYQEEEEEGGEGRGLPGDDVENIEEENVEGEEDEEHPAADPLQYLHQPNEFGRYPIHDVAAGHEDHPEDRLRYLIDNGCDINVPDGDGNTPLALAVLSDQLELVQLILREPKADALKANIYRANPLHHAVDKADVAMVRELLKDERFVDRIDTCDGWNRSTLVLAIRNRKAEIVQLLLESGADPNYAGDRIVVEDERRGRTPLHWAAEYAGTDIVDALIQFGACVNSLDFSLRSPLHVAAMVGNIAVVTKLFACQAFTNYADKLGMTAVDYAFMNKHKGIREYLTFHQSVGPENRERDRQLEKLRRERYFAEERERRNIEDTGNAPTEIQAAEQLQDEMIAFSDQNPN